MEAKTFKVPNITCGHCVMTIQREVSELNGVTGVKADKDSKMVTVEWKLPATWESIAALLQEINYPAEA